MFIGKYELDGKEYFNLYFEDTFHIGDDGWKIWQEDTFSPNTKNIELLEFKIKGKNYKERKGYLENIAIDYSNNFASLSWSYGELAEIGNWFYENGKRYGLLREFRENGVC